jgi:uncharacterized membrane protein HdeD (DUF308 family)
MSSAAVQQTKPAFPWWLVLIEGLAAILIGILLLAKPIQTASILVFSIALFWLLTGIFEIVSLFWDRRQWGWKLVKGIIGIIAGWFLITNMGEGSVVIFGWTVIIVLAIQGILMGIMGLIQAFQGGGWGPGIMGAISIVIGILLLGQPMGFAAVLPWVIGIFAVVGGIFMVIASFRLRRA